MKPAKYGGLSNSARVTKQINKGSNVVVGQKVVNGLDSWRGADLTTDLFVANVAPETTREVATTKIAELGVTVIELETVRRSSFSQSFRLRIKRAEYGQLMKSKDLLPSGITIRRYYYSQQQQQQQQQQQKQQQQQPGHQQ